MQYSLDNEEILKFHPGIFSMLWVEIRLYLLYLVTFTILEHGLQKYEHRKNIQMVPVQTAKVTRVRTGMLRHAMD